MERESSLPPDKQAELNGLRYFEIFKRRGQPNTQYRYERGLPLEDAKRLAEIRQELVDATRERNKGKTFKSGGMWL